MDKQFFIIVTTAIFIAWQAWETRKSAKFLEYQTRPSAFPILWRIGEKTILYVKNYSNTKLFFNLQVIKDGKIIQNFRKDPLNIFPGGMKYPDAFTELDKYLKSFKGSGVFDIKYEMSTISAPNEKYKEYLPDRWSFENNQWIGPDGIRPEGLKSSFNIQD